MKKLLKKIKVILDSLSSEPEVGALRITDASLQYVLLKQEKPISFSIPLPPGAIQEGLVKNPLQFSESLVKLHDLVLPEKKEEVAKATVSLPSALVYTQSFKVPYIDEGKLHESAILNMQMISPIGVEDAYMSWQKIGEADDQLELLGAFISKEALNQIRNSLINAKFYPVTFEFPGLGLARITNEVLGPNEKPIMLIEVSTDGLDLLILRNGSLYFDYFISWSKIQDAEGQITKELFDQMLIREIQKVSNFLISRFKENVDQIILVAPGLEEQIKTLIQNMSLKSAPLNVRYDLGSSWYSVIGSAVRSAVSAKGKKYISLGIEGSVDVFFEERFKNFVHLWRNICAVAFGVIVLIQGLVAISLMLYGRSLATQLLNIKNQEQQRNLTELESKASEFNRLVSMISRVYANTVNWPTFFKNINTLAKENEIQISSLGVDNQNRVVNISAIAFSHEAVLKFKNILVGSPNFENVDLPLSRIGALSDNSVSFSLSFKIKNQ